MSLMKTLAKVAIGVAVAKGVGSMMQKRGAAQADSTAGRGQTYGGSNSPQAGGFEDRMGEMLGKGARRDDSGVPSGGLGDLLDQLGGGQAERGRAPGGASLEDMLGGLIGRGGAQSDGGGGLGDLLKGGQQGGNGGGLGDLLKGAQQGGGGGGLGDLLGGLLGGASQGGGGGGSFGDLLNQSLQRGGEPETAPSTEQEAGAALMLRAMIQAAKSDGKIDDGEREKLLQNLGDVTPDEKAFVNQELSRPVDVQGLARQVPGGMQQQVYMMSLMGIDLDNQNEAQYLNDLATAMKIGPQDVNSIHDSLGMPRIYS